MGDRGNILIKSNGEQVCLYSHWSGGELGETLSRALIRGKSRLDDFQYITRIIFCEMIKGRESELIDFGISQDIHDGNNKVITFDVDKGTVNGVPVSSFIKNVESLKDWNKNA